MYTHIHMYMYMYMYVYMCIYIYIYIHMSRPRQEIVGLALQDTSAEGQALALASEALRNDKELVLEAIRQAPGRAMSCCALGGPPRGFDSSTILSLRGGILMPTGNFRKVSRQRILVGRTLVGRLGPPPAPPPTRPAGLALPAARIGGGAGRQGGVRSPVLLLLLLFVLLLLVLASLLSLLLLLLLLLLLSIITSFKH